MIVEGKLFQTLQEYLEWLKQEWSKDTNHLYTLEGYLAMGEFVWEEEQLKILSDEEESNVEYNDYHCIDWDNF